MPFRGPSDEELAQLLAYYGQAETPPEEAGYNGAPPDLLTQLQRSLPQRLGEQQYSNTMALLDRIDALNDPAGRIQDGAAFAGFIDRNYRHPLAQGFLTPRGRERAEFADDVEQATHDLVRRALGIDQPDQPAGAPGPGLPRREATNAVERFGGLFRRPDAPTPKGARDLPDLSPVETGGAARPPERERRLGGLRPLKLPRFASPTTLPDRVGGPETPERVGLGGRLRQLRLPKFRAGQRSVPRVAEPRRPDRSEIDWNDPLIRALARSVGIG